MKQKISLLLLVSLLSQAAFGASSGVILGGGAGIPTTEKGAPNGVATLDAGGIVPASQLPPGGSGTVTSVGIVAPAEIGVAGSPVTTAGNITLSFATQSANSVFAGPASGGMATPSFRSLVAADMPANVFWSVDGNTGLNDATHFLGTTDGQDVVFKANNAEVMRLDSTNGSLLVGTTSVAPFAISAFRNDTDPVGQSGGAYVNHQANMTADGFSLNVGFQAESREQVAAGFTDGGGAVGGLFNAYRNSGVGDAGTMGYLVGAYGGANQTGSSGNTALAAGFFTQQNVPQGSIVDLYDYYAAPATLGATITNRYGVYISPDPSGVKVNYMADRLMIGSSFSTPSETLAVAGDARVQGSVLFEDPGAGAEVVTLSAPSGLAASYALSLPAADGAAKQLMQTDGSGALSFADITESNVVYVDKSGDDANCVIGAINRPCLSITQAATLIGSAASNAEFNDATERFYLVKVGPGVYTETPTFGTRPQITLELGQATLVGDLTIQFDQGAISGAGLQSPHFIIKGNTARGVAGGLPTQGITGNVVYESVGSGSSLVAILEHTGIAIQGGITQQLGTGGGIFTLTHFIRDSIVTGTIANNAGGGSHTLYINNSDDSSSNAIGAVNGVINLNILSNVRFNGIVDVSGSQTGRWFDVEFRAALAHDFTGASGTISADANSYSSYFVNVPTKGAETFTLLDRAIGVRNTAAGSISATDVQAAINELDTEKQPAFTNAQETPAGAVDNSNVTFTLAFTPTAAASVHLYLDGLIQEQGVDYTISGVTITMAVAPNFAQRIYAVYTR